MIIKKGILVLFVALIFICGAASAWEISDAQNRYNGTVTFFDNGTGEAYINNVYNINFNYNIGDNDTITATYLWYSLPLYYNATGDYIYSPDIANVTLIR